MKVSIFEILLDFRKYLGGKLYRLKIIDVSHQIGAKSIDFVLTTQRQNWVIHQEGGRNLLALILPLKVILGQLDLTFNHCQSV